MTDSGDPIAAQLDRWLPDPVIRSTHRREARATATAVWAAANGVTLGDSRLLGRLVRWRVRGSTSGATYAQVLRAPPFVVLEQGEHHCFSGLCGEIWGVRPRLAQLESAEEFRHWSTPGTTRVLFASWVEPGPSARTALVSEVRVAPVDDRARLRLRSVWTLISTFESLIGAEPLRIAVNRAQAQGPP